MLTIVKNRQIENSTAFSTTASPALFTHGELLSPATGVGSSPRSCQDSLPRRPSSRRRLAVPCVSMLGSICPCLLIARLPHAFDREQLNHCALERWVCFQETRAHIRTSTNNILLFLKISLSPTLVFLGNIPPVLMVRICLWCGSVCVCVCACGYTRARVRFCT